MRKQRKTVTTLALILFVLQQLVFVFFIAVFSVAAIKSNYFYIIPIILVIFSATVSITIFRENILNQKKINLRRIVQRNLLVFFLMISSLISFDLVNTQKDLFQAGTSYECKNSPWDFNKYFDTTNFICDGAFIFAFPSLSENDISRTIIGSVLSEHYLVLPIALSPSILTIMLLLGIKEEKYENF